jgi:hyperosmotically inducible protein
MLARTLAAATLAALVAAPVAAQGTKSDYEIFKDSASKVNSYVYFTVFDDVSLSVDEGIVTLVGKVTMPYKRTDIEKRVSKVEGVRAVENQLSVLPVSQFDDDLRYQIARSIYGNSSFWRYAAMANPPIHILVEHGRVTLTGVVNSEVERMLARSLAVSFGAFTVKNDLKTDAEMRDALEKI